MSFTRGFLNRKVAFYQSIFLIRLIMFEPLYASLQVLPYFQISIIFLIQLAITGFTVFCVVKRIYYNWIFAIFRIATEASILFYLTLGLYC